MMGLVRCLFFQNNGTRKEILWGRPNEDLDGDEVCL